MALETEEAQKLLNKKRKDKKILFNETYKADKEKHQFICIVCSHIWITTPNILKSRDNNGCPECHKKKLKLKKEQAQFSRVSGAIKLLTNSTLPMQDGLESSIKKSNIIQTTDNINSNIRLISEKKATLKKLENINKIDKEELNKEFNTEKKFGWFFALLLFPIWIWYRTNFNEKIRPYKEKELDSSKILEDCNRKISILIGEIEYLRSIKNTLYEELEYEKNISRLSNRLNIKLGSKTRLYYFRFRYKNKQYYKIGITINCVHSRYINGDGSNFRGIEKIFFDTNIYDTRRMEKLILHTFRDKLANDKNILSTKGGYSEVFTSDVLELDNY